MHLFKIVAVLIAAIFYSSLSFSQEKISGKILDEKNQPMPYVNVYVQGYSLGTTSNFEGNFTLTIPDNLLDKKLACKFVGYKAFSKPISSFIKGDGVIKMEPLEINLNEVVISAKGKDPAYYIMRQAIKNKKQFINPVDEYTAELYMKGRAYFSKAPDSTNLIIGLSVNKEDMGELKKEEGKVVFLTESFSKVNFKAPNQIKEELLASKQTGTAPGFSPNRSIYLSNNFYSNSIDGLNERGIISPLSNKAFTYYNFELLGKFEENGQTVNRIKVWPKRASDPAFTGEVFIIQDLWNIHSLELSASKAQISNNFVDSAIFKQSYQDMGNNIWVPLSLQSVYFFKVFGFKLNYEIMGQYTNYNLSPQYPEKFFNAEVYKINDQVKLNDSLAMEKARPVILDSLENTHYQYNDSIFKLENSPAYRDSIRRLSNKPRIGFPPRKYTYTNKKNDTYTLTSIISSLNFTAVDAWVIQPEITYKNRDSTGYSADEIVFSPRYSTSRGKFQLAGSYTHEFNRINHPRLTFAAGSTTRQINAIEPISPFFQTYYAYFRERNFGQYLGEEYFSLEFGREIFNGLRAEIGVKYANRFNLSNVEQKPLFKNFEDRNFTENLNSEFPGHILVSSLKLRYRIKQKYSSYPNRKIYHPNRRYPELFAKVLFAPEGISNTSFTYLEFVIRQRVDLAMLGTFDYSVSAGDFIESKNLGLFDYRHFAGNQTRYFNTRFRAFQVLPYYAYSTENKFFEFHASQHFNGFILNKIPLIKKLKWQSYVDVNGLISENQNDYYEAVIGIENIFSFFSVQLAAPYLNNNFGKPFFMFGASLSF